MTHFAETFKYMLDGVKNSAGTDENIGTRFGGFGDITAAASTSRTVSREGWIPNCMVGHGVSFPATEGLRGLGPAYL